MPRELLGCINNSLGFTVNGMMWHRPTEAETNKLEALGNPGWNWDTLSSASTPQVGIVET